jgi:hypothetical protein
MEDKIPTEQEAVHGEKLIEVKVGFWTNNIAAEEGKIVPNRAWTSGVVRLKPNPSHGIAPGSEADSPQLTDGDPSGN